MNVCIVAFNAESIAIIKGVVLTISTNSLAQYAVIVAFEMETNEEQEKCFYKNSRLANHGNKVLSST